MVLESVVCLAWKATLMSLYRGESIEGYKNANGGFDFCQNFNIAFKVEQPFSRETDKH